ncbi:MAG: sugar phosphate isomerase/epimerase [Polyangiaceae bacterium]|jgi:hexulose-6-phosphate isomerase|nr:sugar phosphate isomerase/epimerase [Polyangiaceae bacterium]
MDDTSSQVLKAAPRAELRVGVMQGRLSPRPPGKLQEFPWQSYAAEFPKAARLGLHSIEWIFDAPRYEENPIWTEAGREEIRGLIAATGVRVQSVCADYFMLHRLAGESPAALAHHRDVLADLIVAAHAVGADRILIPLLETSAVDSPELKREVALSLRSAVPMAERYGVTLGLEMEIPGHEYAKVVESVGSAKVRAYYDTGNSTAQGLDIAQDIAPLLPLLHAVHVKDRVRGGSSKPLGTGDANFQEFFPRLLRAGFRGDFVLQHYFEADPELEAERSLRFVEQLIDHAKSEAA